MKSRPAWSVLEAHQFDVDLAFFSCLVVVATVDDVVCSPALIKRPSFLALYLYFFYFVFVSNLTISRKKDLTLMG